MPRTCLLLLTSLLLLAGCKTESYQSVERPSEDVLLTSPDLCRVYLMRSPQVRGKIRTVRVFEDELEIGRVGPEEYLCWEHRPGRRLLRLVYEGPRLDGADVESLFPYEAEPGQVYYFSVHLQDTTEVQALGKKTGSPIAERLTAQEGARQVAERRPAEQL